MNWKLKRTWGWIETFFHAINFLLSESCVWLSLLKFFSTDPFTVDHQTNKTKFVVAEIVFWFVTVVAHASMNTLTHFLMIYHHHCKASHFTKHFTISKLKQKAIVIFVRLHR